jgi:hypothetical protein
MIDSLKKNGDALSVNLTTTRYCHAGDAIKTDKIILAVNRLDLDEVIDLHINSDAIGFCTDKCRTFISICAKDVHELFNNWLEMFNVPTVR